MEISALYPELIVKNLDVSANFYVNILGFTVEFSRPEERFHFLSFGKAQVMLLEDNENQHSRTGPMEYPRGQGVNFSIVTEDIEHIWEKLAANDYPTRIPIRDQWHRQEELENGERQLWVMEPDGYLLRFIQKLGSRPITARS